MNGNLLAADTATEISARQVPVEPMVRFRYCIPPDFPDSPRSLFSFTSLPSTSLHRYLFSSLANTHPRST
jgi:hypothetical protein